MKKVCSLVLSFIMAFTIVIPSAAFAVDEENPPAEPAVGEEAPPAEPAVGEEAQPAEPAVSEEAQPAEPEVSEEAQPAESAVSEEAQPAEPEVSELNVEDSYGPLKLKDAYAQNAIVLPESMQPVPSSDDPDKLIDQVTFSEPKYGNGLLLTGKAGVLSSDRIGLNAQLDFNSNPVGRVSVDGLCKRGVTVKVNIYLDDQEEPVASFELGSTMGKKDWANAGDHTADVYGLNLTGQHSVSFSFEISGKADKETSILLRSIEFSESSIPVLYFNIDESLGTIDAMNGSSDHSVECYGSFDLQIPDGFSGDYDGGAQKSLKKVKLDYIRGRGNSTWGEDKKPYKVKLKDSTNLFGMGKNKHWILLANRFDNSLIRNRMTYWLGAQMGLDYTPQCVPVDLVMNGKYYGSYLLCEQIRIAESRVAINDLEDNEDSMHATELPFISGGYLLSMSPYGDEDPANIFHTSRDVSMFIESPSFEDFDNDTQRQYIIGYVQATENAIFGPNFSNGDVHYTDLLDIDAAAKYWWIQEFSANGDAYGSGSTFLYKKQDEDGEPGKLFWGPLWDFDYVAWGDLDYDVNPPEGFDYTSTPWFDRMKLDPAFNAKQKAYWTGENDVPSLDALLTDIVKEGGLLDQYYEQTKTSWKYDHEKWGSYGEGWGSDDESSVEVSRTYKEEVDQLRNWIIGRQENVNRDIDSLSPEMLAVTFKIGSKTVDTIQIGKGRCIESFPKAPAKKGYLFRGWQSKKYGIITEYDEILENMVLTASYIKESQAVKAKKLYFRNYNVYRPLYEEYDSDNEYLPDYTIMPYDSDETQVSWSSSNKAVATVDSYGTVTFKKTGTVKITGKVGSVSNSYTLHIYDPFKTDLNERQSFAFDKKTLKLAFGGYGQIRATFEPQPCEEGYLTWVSLNDDIASVDYLGVVQANARGTTTILAIDTDSNVYQTCKVTVTSKGKTKPVNPVKLAAPKLKLTANYSKKQIKVSWSKVKGAKSYKIIYRKIGTKKWKTLKTTKTSVTISKLNKKTPYEFCAQAVGKSKSNNSNWSAVKRIYFQKMKVKAKPGKKKVVVRWKKDKKANGYQIRYSYSSNMSKAKTILVKKNKSKYKIRKLKKGKKVFIQIRPYKKYKGTVYYGIYSNRKAVRVK